MPQKGVDILIYANTGTPSVPVWEPVGGQRDATLTDNSDTVDVTRKPTDGTRLARELEYGEYSWSISAGGVYIPSDDAYKALRSAIRNGDKIKVRWKEGADYTWEGTAVVTSHSIEGPYNAEATYSIDMEGDGLPTELPEDESNDLSTLTGIEENAGAALVFVPAFAGATYRYHTEVNTASGWVKFTPTAVAGTITVDGATVPSGTESQQIDIGAADSLTDIVITVQETGKAAKVYTITIARP